VRRGLSQPMRSLALAHLLLAEAEAEHVVYSLCAPDGHAAIWRRPDEVSSLRGLGLRPHPDTSPLDRPKPPRAAVSLSIRPATGQR
jgi:hypothetical protein